MSAIGAAAELIEAPTYIVNNSGSSVDFKWERIEYNLPAGWNASFCDKTIVMLPLQQRPHSILYQENQVC